MGLPNMLLQFLLQNTDKLIFEVERDYQNKSKNTLFFNTSTGDVGICMKTYIFMADFSAVKIRKFSFSENPVFYRKNRLLKNNLACEDRTLNVYPLFFLSCI